MENSTGVFLKKTKIRATIWSSNPNSGHICKENHNLKRYMHPNVHYSRFTIAETWKQPKCLSTDAWIKIWYTYTMKYYSAIKKNEVMPCPIKWTDLEIIIHSEISQTKINITWYLYVEFKKWYIWTYLQNRNKFRFRKQTYGYQGGKMGWRDKLGGWK